MAAPQPELKTNQIFDEIGHFSEAQKILPPRLDVEHGVFSDCCGTGVRDTSSAAAILHTAGISDEEIARQLDVVGEVLRSHKLRLDRISVDAVNVPEVYSGVSVQCHVKDRTNSDIFQLNLELSALAEKRHLPVHDALVVLFASHVDHA